MKLLILCILLMQLSIVNCLSHKEWVHQYIVKEAYNFLENEVGEIPELKSYLGFNYYGGSNWNVCPWEEQEAVAIGSWREDLFDPIWFYGALTYGFTPSITHFWKADEGDDWQAFVLGPGYVANAFKKAKMYYWGQEESQYYKYEHEGNYQIIINGVYIRAATIIRTYPCLPTFYKEGKSKLLGYRGTFDYLARTNVNKNIIMHQETRKRHTFHILGRIAHLLADMSVPAHVHDDPHICDGGLDGDRYELWMGSSSIYSCNTSHVEFLAKNWTAITAREQGGLLLEVLSMNDRDALRYLFYTMNQYTDHYPSWYISLIQDPSEGKDADGNHYLPQGDSPFMNFKYAELGAPPYLPMLEECANETFNYCIRATATLFYWFCVKLGIIENCQENLYKQNETIFGLPNSETQIFECSNKMFVGKNVTNEIPVGQVIFKNTSNSVLRAGTSISFQDGFIAESGSFLEAIIESPCISFNEYDCSPDGNIVVFPEKTIVVFPAEIESEEPCLTDTMIIGCIPNEIINVNQALDTSTVWAYYYYSLSNCFLEDTVIVLPNPPIDTIFAKHIIIKNYDDSTVFELFYEYNPDTLFYYRAIVNPVDSTVYINKIFEVSQNHSVIKSVESFVINPNPSSEEITINFNLKEASNIRIDIYNTLGEKIITPIFLNENKIGEVTRKLNITFLNPGLYFCTIQTNSNTSTKSFFVTR